MKLVPISLLSDGDLVRRALGENPHAAEELVFRYQRKACAIVRAMGIRQDRIDDIIQESFLKAFGELRNLERPGAFGAWFLTIVRNTARNHLRSSSRSPVVYLAGDQNIEEGEPGEKADFEEYIWRKVAELPEGIREAIFLYYHEGESTRAVANALGIDRSVVKNRLFRGREILRDKLWREIGECLRDMLPSAREWKRKARRMGILVFTALSVSNRLAARAFPARGAPARPLRDPAPQPPGPALLKGTPAWIPGGKKLAILTITIGVLLTSGGILLWSWRAGRGRVEEPGRKEALVNRVIPPAAQGERTADANVRAVPGAAREEEASVFGRVTDTGGMPLTGAIVLAIDLARWSAAGGEWDRLRMSGRTRPAVRLKALEEGYRRAAESVPREETGTDGSYAFRGLGDGAYWILAAHPDHLPGTENLVTVRRGAPVRRDIALVPGQFIQGRVLDESGRPVEGAEVTGTGSDGGTLRGSDRIERVLADWEEGLILLGEGGVRTDAGGSFRLSSLEPAAYDLAARKEDFLTGLAFGVPAGSSEVVLTLSRGTSTWGRVLTPSRTPLRGAAVILAPERSGEVHRLFDLRHGDASQSAGRTAVTGEEGRFRVGALDQGLYSLSVSADGFPPIWRYLEIGPGGADLGDIVLEQPRSIGGIVRGPGGAAVEGAEVRILLLRDQAMPASEARVASPGAERAIQTMTDAGGRFQLHGLPGGTFEVRAEAADLAPASAMARAGNTNLEILLAAGLTVHGKVVEDAGGAPVAGAEVRIPAREGKGAVTDEKGNFVIRGVPPESASFRGTVLVEARHPAFGLYRGYEFPGGHGAESPLEIRLFRMGYVNGRAMDPAGRGIEGIRVWLEGTGMPPDDRNRSPFEYSRCFSSTDGSFSIPIGSWAMWLQADLRIFAVACDRTAGRGRVGPMPLPGAGQGWPRIDLVLSPGATVEGTVTGEDGSPAAGARVEVESAEAGVGRYSRGWLDRKVGYSLADGRFLVEGAEPGPSVITARAAGYAARRIECIIADEPAAPLAIVLERGRSIEGRVLDGRGRPIPLAEVVALAGEEGGEGGSEFARRMDISTARGILSTRTGMDGRYRLGPLPRGLFRVAGRCEGYEAARIEPVEAGRGAPAIILNRYAALRGAILDSGTGEPIPGFRINVILKKKIHPSLPEEIAGTEGDIRFDDLGGRFLYDGLRPGEYVVSVRATGYAPHRREVVIAAGEEIELDVALERGHRIEGVLLDAESGLPIAGAQVGARPRGIFYYPLPDNPLDAFSREDGTFSIGGLSPGDHTLFIVHPHCRRWYEDPRDFSIPGAESSRMEIRLAPAGRLQGWIRGLEVYPGSTAERPYIVRKRIGEGGVVEEGEEKNRYKPLRNALLFPDGRFEADHVQPGTYRLELHVVRVEPDKKVAAGPGRSSPSSVPRETLSVKVLGEVEIRPRETTYRRFDL